MQKKMYIFCAGCKFGHALYWERPFLRTVLFRESLCEIGNRTSLLCSDFP